jgi:hypothetical protein
VDEPEPEPEPSPEANLNENPPDLVIHDHNIVANKIHTFLKVKGSEK